MKKRDVYNWSRRRMRGKRKSEDEGGDAPLWQRVIEGLVILGLCGFLIWLGFFA